MASMVVRVAGNVEELRKNLAEGRSQIETTTAAMQKMASSFSGDKLIQAAMNVTAAVDKIGGASKLTEAEAARVNATLEKALEKYAVLGREAPAGMQKLADETKQVDTTSGGLTETVKQLALSFAAMFTARAAFNFVKDTINEASALKDLGQQTHIGVEELQLMAGAMSEFGVSQEELGKGLYKLSRGIAGGDESVTHGLHLMGMSLKDVDGLEGKELFLKIEGGLAQLQGGLRDTTAAELFGGKLGAAMAGASEGIEGALEHWSRLNHVVSKESVDALDEFGESIERTKDSLSAIATNMIGPVAQGFNTLIGAAEQGASKFSIFWAMTKDYFDTQAMGSAQTGNLTKLLLDLNTATDKGTVATTGNTASHREAVVALDAHGQAAKFMAAIELDTAKPLLQWQLDYMNQLEAVGRLNAKNAEGIGVSAQQYAKYTDEVKKTAEAAKAYEEALKTLAVEHEFQIDLHIKTQAAIAKTNVAYVKLTNEAVLREFDAQVKLNAAQGLDAAGAIKVQLSALEVYELKLKEITKVKVAGISTVAQEKVAYDAYMRSLYDTAVAQDTEYYALLKTNEEAKKVPGVMAAATDALTTFNNAQKATQMESAHDYKQSWMSIYEAQGKSKAEAEGMFYAKNAVKGYDYGPSSDYRAEGGPVRAGESYVVGEKRPELFVPSSNGTILPSLGGMGGHTYITNVYVTQPFGTPDAIGDAIMARQRSLGDRMPWQS